MFKKRGQMTLFVILALVIFSVSTVIISVNKEDIESELETDFKTNLQTGVSDIKTIKTYLEDVAKKISYHSLQEAANSGGFIGGVDGFDYSKLGLKSKTYLEYAGYDVLYYTLDYTNNNGTVANPWNVSHYPCFRHELPDSCLNPTGFDFDPYYGNLNFERVTLDMGDDDIADTIQDLLELYIAQKIEETTSWDYIENNYEINHSGVNVNLEFNDLVSNNKDSSTVTVTVNYGISLISKRTGDVVKLSDFVVTVPAKFSSMFKLAKRVYLIDAVFFDYDLATTFPPSLNHAGFTIRLINNAKDGDAIYEIVDDDFRYFGFKNFTYRFAIKNRPPVLNHIPYNEPGDTYFYIREGERFIINNIDGYDVDDESFIYEVSNIVGGKDDSLNLFKKQTSISDDGSLNIDTTGMQGEFDFTIVADDGKDYDSQDLKLIINDIPEIKVSMENGYYWYADLEVLSDEYWYDFKENFVPAGYFDPKRPGKKNEKNKMLYLPCENKDVYEGIVPKDEYVKINATVIDEFYDKNHGYTHDWSYVCSDTPAVEEELAECRGLDECYVNIQCGGSSQVTIKLNVSDGIDYSVEDFVYLYEPCLGCRTCCGAVPKGSGDYATFYNENEPGEGADYYVTKFGNEYLYSKKITNVEPLKSVVVDRVGKGSGSYPDYYYSFMDYLRYDSTSSTGFELGTAYLNVGKTQYRDCILDGKEYFYDGACKEHPKVNYDGATALEKGKMIITSDDVDWAPYYFDFDRKPTDYEGNLNDYYDQSEPIVFSACFLHSDVKDESSNIHYFENGNYYVDGYYIYKLSCNDLNSFADPLNLRFGEYTNKLVPYIYVKEPNKKITLSECSS